MAMGGDQGGSIRIPAAACGIVGLKPTHGLVPYTGIVPVHLLLDHTGPMARTVTDAALLLEVSLLILYDDLLLHAAPHFCTGIHKFNLRVFGEFRSVCEEVNTLFTLGL